jgi:hypothetical protein
VAFAKSVRLVTRRRRIRAPGSTSQARVFRGEKGARHARFNIGAESAIILALLALVRNNPRWKTSSVLGPRAATRHTPHTAASPRPPTSEAHARPRRETDPWGPHVSWMRRGRLRKWKVGRRAVKGKWAERRIRGPGRVLIFFHFIFYFIFSFFPIQTPI